MCLLVCTSFSRTYAEATEFTRGLNSLGGLWDVIESASDVMMPLLVNKAKPLDVDTVRKMTMVEYSEEKSNNRVAEADTMYCLEMYLKRCAGRLTRQYIYTVTCYVKSPAGFLGF